MAGEVGEKATSCNEHREDEGTGGRGMMTIDKLVHWITTARVITSGHWMSTLADDRITITQNKPSTDEVCIILPCSHSFVSKRRNVIRMQDFDSCNIPETKQYPCGHRLLITCSESKLYAQELAECPFPCGWTTCLRGLHPQKPCESAHSCRDRTQCVPCQAEVQYLLGCQHKVTRRCFENWSEDDYICKEVCGRIGKNCRHPCKKMCWEECDSLCMRMMPRMLPSCPVGHYSAVMCHVQNEALAKMKCADLCDPRKTKPRCGHAVQVFCFDADKVTTENLAWRCQAPCNGPVLEGCGHKCTGCCRDCFQGSFHKRCEQRCQRILICNHSCDRTCGDCQPCRMSCGRKCPHKSCQLECGVPCGRWECREPCVYACTHGRCTQQCDQICDKKPCEEPCPLKLDCGHFCVGFCGEPCPPCCRYCSPEKLRDGALYTPGEIGEHENFIYLTGCGHCVESKAMDAWMRVNEEEITVKGCPICRTRLNWMHRYSEILHANWDAVELVKKRIFGDESRIEECLLEIEDKLSEEYKIIGELGGGVECFYPKFLRCIKEKIDRDDKLGCRRVDMHWEAVRFIRWMLDEWSLAGRQAAKNKESLRLHPDLEDVALGWKLLFQFVSRRNWPFQVHELKAYLREKQRLEDYSTVYTTLETAHAQDMEKFKATFWSDACQITFGHVLGTLKTSQGYSPRHQERFKQNLNRLKSIMKVTLVITEEERLKIVEAFGGMQSGRWFKCKNGHVYVITECAGAVVEAKCPECQEKIGGSNHQVREDNVYASEMDGAVEGAYDVRMRLHEEIMRQIQ